MSKAYIHNGEDWCNICSGKAKIRVPSEEWVQVDPLNKETKIFNGEEWVPLDCCYACDVDTPLPRPAFQGDRLYVTTNRRSSMDFMDDIDLMPTCEELKNLLCPGEGLIYPTRGVEQELNSIHGCPVVTYQAWINGTATIEDIQDLIRSKRDAWIQSFNELILANSPFVWANDYLPFHRWKAEEI